SLRNMQAGRLRSSLVRSNSSREVTMKRKAGVVITLLTALALAVPVAAQTVNLMLSTMPAGKDPQRYKGFVEPKYKEFDRRSIYLTMRDGVRIAVDIVLPKPLPVDEKLP